MTSLDGINGSSIQTSLREWPARSDVGNSGYLSEVFLVITSHFALIS